MPAPRALLVHVTLPPWIGRAGLDAAWEERFGPLFAGLLDARTGRVALLLGGRIAEEWSQRHPEIVHGLRQRLTEGRLELVASALHGAVLGAVPEADAVDQLRAHTTLLKRVLGARPNGGWVPQGVWDPLVPRLFNKAGLTWTCLARDWLSAARAPAAPALSVERGGRSVAVVPWERLPADGSPRWTGLAVQRVDTMDDVRRVLQALPFTEVLPSSLAQRVRTRAYLPPGEIGGLWERHLLDDAGADALHKRMLAVSREVRRLERAVQSSSHSDDGPDPHALHQARRYLHRAQSAEAYAPTPAVPVRRGAFRDRAWRDLIRAECVVDDALGSAPCDASTRDADGDGVPEVRLRTARWAVTVAPGREGTLTELTDRRAGLNIVGGALPMAFRELWDGVEPVAMAWDLVTTESPGEGAIRAVLVADGSLHGVPLRLTKVVHAPPAGPLGLRIDVTSRGRDVARGHLSTELYVVLGGPRLEGDEDASLSVEVAGGKVPLDERIALPELDCVSVIGWRGRVELEPSPPGRVEIEPLEEGAARVLITWSVELLERDRERREVRVAIREVPHG